MTAFGQTTSKEGLYGAKVTLTIYLHGGNLTGPLLPSVQVTGQDASGNSFSQITNTNGSVVINGQPGTWQLTFSKDGYEPSSLNYSVTKTQTTASYLRKISSLLVPYTDAQWNFTIQMPKGWAVGKGTNINRTFTIFLSPNPERNQTGDIVFNENINIVKERTNRSFDSYVTLSKQALTKYLQDYRIIEERNVTLGGTAGKVIGGTFTQNGLQLRSLQLFVQTGSLAYVLTALNLVSKWESDKDLIEASLMSFRPPFNSVLLVFSVHDGNLTGPLLPGVKITGRDGFGNNFSLQTTSKTGTFGQVGAFVEPGMWKFTLSKDGYGTSSVYYNVTRTERLGAYIPKIGNFSSGSITNPQDSMAWNNKGSALIDQGKYDEAIQACDKAIKINPQFALAWNTKGVALHGLGKYDEEVQAYNKAIESNPQFAQAWNNKGNALYAQGKYDEAAQAYNKVIEINPQDAHAWNNKGVALQGMGKYDDAITAHNKAIEINPQFAQAWYDKGNALYGQGKYDDAITAYNKAIEINPQDADTWKYKGEALKSLGRTTEADSALAKARELTYMG